MEEHLDNWIDHLENNVVPELEEVNNQIQYEYQKIQKLTQHFDKFNQAN